MKKFLILLTLLVILTACGTTRSTTGRHPAPLDPNFAFSPPQAENTANEEAQAEGTANEETTPTPTFGGQINIAMPMPQTLNPLLNSDPHLAQVLRLIFEPLVILDEEQKPIPNPAITESIIFAPSGQSLTITLKENIFWEDETPITSADIAFSIDVLRHQSPQTAIYRPNTANIVNHTIADAKTININLNAPMWQMMYLLDFPIIPRHYYNPVSMLNLRHARNMHPVGNGPFRFYSYVLAANMDLIANENAPGGRPYIDKIRAVVLRDLDNAKLYAFEQGVIDIFTAHSSDWGRFRAMGKNQNEKITTGYFDFIGFNHSRTIFAEQEARLAISRALDWDNLLNRHYHGLKRAKAPIHPDSWLSIETQTNTQMNTQTNTQTNIQTTAELFAQMGFKPADDGILQRQPSPVLPPIRLTLSIIANEENPQTTAIAEALHIALTSEGVASALQILEPSEFQNRLASGDFDIVVGRITLQNPINMDFLRYGHPSSVFNYNSKVLNGILDEIKSAPNPSALQESTANAQNYIAQNLPIIGIAFHDKFIYTSGRVHGNAQNWFVEP